MRKHRPFAFPESLFKPRRRFPLRQPARASDGRTRSQGRHELDSPSPRPPRWHAARRSRKAPSATHAMPTASQFAMQMPWHPDAKFGDSRAHYLVYHLGLPWIAWLPPGIPVKAYRRISCAISWKQVAPSFYLRRKIWPITPDTGSTDFGPCRFAGAHRGVRRSVQYHRHERLRSPTRRCFPPYEPSALGRYFL